MQEKIQDLTRYQNLQEATHEWQQSGGNNADLYRLREQAVGAEAANRLAQLDTAREEFHSRLDSWLAERATLMNNPSLAEADRKAQITRLRTQHFSDDELARVQTKERIADDAAP